MRLTLIVIAALVGAACASIAEFEAFKVKYQKQYANTVEEQKRFGIFSENMQRAAKLNKANPKATFGASPFADMTPEEFKVYHNSDSFYAARVEELKHNANYYPLYPKHKVAAVTASNIDWRAKGAVTAVKNQGQCGSCWAFSTTGGIEGQWFLAGHTLTSLSEQELVSCDTTDSGCNGGLMNTAMEWLLSAKGGAIVTEASYPYVSGGGTAPACQPNKGTKGATIVGHYNIYHAEEQMLAWMEAHGPLSLAVDASAWQLYVGGIMTDCGGSSLDHGVLIVGYVGTGTSTPYWIFKNSWGASWGEQGYIYIEYGNDQCLLTHYPVTSIVNGTAPAPTPLPNKPYFTYEIFDDQACTVGGQTFVFEDSTCVSWDGISFTATCSASGVSITAYYDSLTCTGQSTSVSEPVNSCQEAQADFAYYKNACHTGDEGFAPRRHATNSKKALNHFAQRVKKAMKK